MKRTLRLERTYPHPPERVWRAITDPVLLGEWLMPNDFRPEVGHVFTMRSDPRPGWDGVVYLKVLALDAGRSMTWHWRGGPLDTTVTFQLEPVDGGTRLLLEHAGFDTVPAILVSFLLGSGWGSMLRTRIPAILARLAA